MDWLWLTFIAQDELHKGVNWYLAHSCFQARPSQKRVNCYWVFEQPHFTCSLKRETHTCSSGVCDFEAGVWANLVLGLRSVVARPCFDDVTHELEMRSMCLFSVIAVWEVY